MKLKCISCNREYPIDEMIYYCKFCNDLLEVVYDKSELEKKSNSSDWKKLPLSVWRYYPFLPFNDETSRITLNEGGTGLHRCERLAAFLGLKNIYIKNEGENPTGSFKDRGMTVGVSKALELGVSWVICASTGNTSASLSAYAARAGLKRIVLIPSGKVAYGKLAQAMMCGAQVVQVRGNFDEALEMVMDLAERYKEVYLLNSVNPFRLEGQKTIVYRILENLDWNPPDWLVYPGGALGNTASCGKCLMELYEWEWIKKVPRLVVVNSTGANTFFELVNGQFEGQKLRWNAGNIDTTLIDRYYTYKDSKALLPKTKATAIQIGKPANIAKALRALEFTDGLVVQVDDREMSHGMAVVGLNGFDCEMASGAVPAGIKALREQEVIKNDDIIVGVLTGRQKDPALAVEYHTDSKNMFARPPIV